MSRHDCIDDAHACGERLFQLLSQSERRPNGYDVKVVEIRTRHCVAVCSHDPDEVVMATCLGVILEEGVL